MLSKSTETFVKIINYHILSYFLRKPTFREATLGRMFFFCLKSLLFVPRVSLVMSSVTCNSNCILFYIASNVHLVVICGSTNVETPTVEFTIVEVHLKWYIVPGLVSGYYFFTLVQQKVQLLHKRPNVKMFNHVSTC